jgi:hypothetical protein
LLRRAQNAAGEKEDRETSQENNYASSWSVSVFGAEIGIGLHRSIDKGQKQIERLGHAGWSLLSAILDDDCRYIADITH